jgi:hypothetical protein
MSKIKTYMHPSIQDQDQFTIKNIHPFHSPSETLISIPVLPGLIPPGVAVVVVVAVAGAATVPVSAAVWSAGTGLGASPEAFILFYFPTGQGGGQRRTDEMEYRIHSFSLFNII